MDFSIIIMMVALFAIMYFLMIRPQQKKMRQDQEMRSQIAAGDRVLLTSGIFATVTHVGERQFIVELAPQVEVTVLKGAIARAANPEDEEFEFADDAEDVVADAEEQFDPTTDAVDDETLTDSQPAEASVAETARTEEAK